MRCAKPLLTIYMEGWLLEAVGVVVGIVVMGNKFLVERHRWNETIDTEIERLPLLDTLNPTRLVGCFKEGDYGELGIKVKDMNLCVRTFI